MIVINKTIVSDDLANIRFACDLKKCHGACCVEGDAGAPLEAEEISLIGDHIEEIKEFMVPEGIAAVEKNGVYDYDASGAMVTPLVNDKECVFVYFDGPIARCAIEKAYQEGRILFAKPISCHLYPVRINEYENFEGVNYHRWYICSKALTHGKRKGIYLYRFLKDSLVRKYGHKWYNELVRQIEKKQK
jgi:hypothetical protein